MLTSLCSPTYSLFSTFVLWYFVFAQRLHSTLIIMPRRVWKERCYFIIFLIWLFPFRMKHQCSRGIRSLHFLGLFWGGGTKLPFSSGENEPFQEGLGNCGSCSLLPSPYDILYYKQDKSPDRLSLLSLYFHLIPSPLCFPLLASASQLACTTAHLLVLDQASAVKATVTQKHILLNHLMKT